MFNTVFHKDVKRILHHLLHTELYARAGGRLKNALGHFTQFRPGKRDHKAYFYTNIGRAQS